MRTRNKAAILDYLPQSLRIFQRYPQSNRLVEKRMRTIHVLFRSNAKRAWRLLYHILDPT